MFFCKHVYQLSDTIGLNGYLIKGETKHETFVNFIYACLFTRSSSYG
jgi:hypothetical protein